MTRPEETTTRMNRGRLPDFIVIGAPRSGTTWLSWHLSGQPGVHMAPQKEIHFFDRKLRRGVDWYRAQFEGASRNQLVGEATPIYMFQEEAIKRMSDVVPEARLIAILREPAARAYSAFWFRQGLGERRRSFEDALDEEQRPGYVERWRRPPLIAAGMYLPALQQVCGFFPRSSLLVLLFDDLRRDPVATYTTLSRFLGIDEGATPVDAGRPVNKTHRLRSPTLFRVMQRTRAWRRWPFRAGFRVDDWNRVPFNYPAMKPETKARLHALYAEPNQALGRWLQRDLSMWEGA